MSTLIFTGGGTGGHVYPGLAIIEALPAAVKHQVLWVGSSRGIERMIIQQHGLRYASIPCGKLRRYFDLQNVWDVFRICAGLFRALSLLRSEQAKLVFSKGGYIAVPVVLAAFLRRIPVYIHESDMSAGLATRISVRCARRIFAAHRDVLASLPPRYHARVVISGNPIRKEFFSADKSTALQALGMVDTGQKILLVSGGSQGARQLNELVLCTIRELCKVCVVIHQTGIQGQHFIAQTAAQVPHNAYYGAALFTDAFPALLRRAAIAVCRAGAGTIWELAAAQCPAVLLPLSTQASRGDQIDNARSYTQAGCAVMLNETQVKPGIFMQAVQNLLQDEAAQQKMRKAASLWGSAAQYRNAAQGIAQEISKEYTSFIDTNNG